LKIWFDGPAERHYQVIVNDALNLRLLLNALLTSRAAVEV
jgi:hypothetical protein